MLAQISWWSSLTAQLRVNSGPAGSGVVIKNPGHHSSPNKLAKAIIFCGTSYEGELEAIKLGKDYAFQNIGQANSLFI